jgi:hypothetical protein
MSKSSSGTAGLLTQRRYGAKAVRAEEVNGGKVWMSTCGCRGKRLWLTWMAVLGTWYGVFGTEYRVCGRASRVGASVGFVLLGDAAGRV